MSMILIGVITNGKDWHNIKKKDNEIHSGDIGTFRNRMEPRDIPAKILFLNSLWHIYLKNRKIKVFYNLLKFRLEEKCQNKE